MDVQVWMEHQVRTVLRESQVYLVLRVPWVVLVWTVYPVPEVTWAPTDLMAHRVSKALGAHRVLQVDLVISGNLVYLALQVLSAHLVLLDPPVFQDPWANQVQKALGASKV